MRSNKQYCCSIIYRHEQACNRIRPHQPTEADPYHSDYSYRKRISLTTKVYKFNKNNDQQQHRFRNPVLISWLISVKQASKEVY